MGYRSGHCGLLEAGSEDYDFGVGTTAIERSLGGQVWAQGDSHGCARMDGFQGLLCFGEGGLPSRALGLRVLFIMRRTFGGAEWIAI